VINNQAFVTSCAQGHNFKANHLITTNNASHNLTLPKSTSWLLFTFKKTQIWKIFYWSFQNFIYFLKFSNNTYCIIKLSMPTSQIYRLHGFIPNQCKIYYFMGSYCLHTNVMHYVNMKVICVTFVCKQYE